MFPYALSPRHERAKRNTIRVIRKISSQLPHYTSPTLPYPMENEMPLICHTVEQWGCGYTIEDNNKGLNERTQRHPMLNPMFKPMQAKWE